MGAVWQVQEAKNRFSEVIERALHDGPQTVTRHGRPVVRVVAVEEVEVEQRASPALAPRADDGFAAFLLSMPKIEGGLPAMPRHPTDGRAPIFGEG
jgi:antitoxin Phd